MEHLQDKIVSPIEAFARDVTPRVILIPQPQILLGCCPWTMGDFPSIYHPQVSACNHYLKGRSPADLLSPIGST